MVTESTFEIANITAYHLALDDQPGYWEDYRGGGSARREPARLEFREGWQTVYPTTVEAMLLRVELADGSTGWGESNTPIGPEVTALISQRLLKSMVAGRSFDSPVALWDFLYDAQRGRGYAAGYYLDAMAALDIAVWDALGHRAGLPVARLLTDLPRQRLPVYLSGLRQATRSERIEAMHQWLDTGLSGVKIFVDGDLDAAAQELEALQRAGGGTAEQWMVDTLWMCRGDDGRRAKALFGDLGVRWLECPLQPEDLAGHRQLAGEPGAPIALGEHFRTHYQTADWFGPPPALDVYQPDIGRTGLSDGLRQIETAQAAGVPSTPHMGSGLHVFQSATLHFATACWNGGPTNGRPAHGLTDSTPGSADEAGGMLSAAPGSEVPYLQEYQAGLAQRGDLVGRTSWQYADGAFELPEVPGLGVEIDEEALARYTVT